MNDQAKIQRTVLPIPDQPLTGLITYDAKDPDTRFPPIRELRPPAGSRQLHNLRRECRWFRG
jgi:arylsulfatase